MHNEQPTGSNFPNADPVFHVEGHTPQSIDWSSNQQPSHLQRIPPHPKHIILLPFSFAMNLSQWSRRLLLDLTISPVFSRSFSNYPSQM